MGHRGFNSVRKAGIWLLVLVPLAFGSGIATAAPQKAAARSVVAAVQGVANSTFSETVPGVISGGSATGAAPAMALTLDLCDGGFDESFVRLLRFHKVKATLFVSGRWARRHREVLVKLAQDPLFVIANHGYQHRPLASTPRRIYGIASTRNLWEAYDEVVKNQTLLTAVTGQVPRYYRSGTAYYDEQAVALVTALGLQVVGYNVLPGDAAHPHNRRAMVSKLLQAKPGAIILMHLNHPEWQSREAFGEALGVYQQRGYRFVHLPELLGEAADD